MSRTYSYCENDFPQIAFDLTLQVHYYIQQHKRMMLATCVVAATHMPLEESKMNADCSFVIYGFHKICTLYVVQFFINCDQTTNHLIYLPFFNFNFWPCYQSYEKHQICRYQNPLILAKFMIEKRIVLP